MGILGSLFGKKKMTAAETAFIKRQSQIFADCIRIIADTDNIETYFSRYKLAELPIQTVFFLGTSKKKPCIFSAYLAGR